MMIPTIHLNGTGKAMLQQELREAQTALQVAIEKLAQVTVHGRDYYVQGPSAYGQAREEMDRRLAALRNVSVAISALYQGIEEQS